jgi:translation elongation factor EF-1beta
MKINMNFEEDTRHDISRKTLSNLERVMYKQDNFGMEKYKEALNSNMKYSWIDMATEEFADGLKYFQCEIERKEEVIQLLEAAIRVDNPKEYVQTALELLKIGGTGK